jgi:hypothetical protein
VSERPQAGESAAPDAGDLAAAVANLSLTVDALRMTLGTEMLELRGRLRAVENRLAEAERANKKHLETAKPARESRVLKPPTLSRAELTTLREAKAAARAKSGTESAGTGPAPSKARQASASAAAARPSTRAKRGAARTAPPAKPKS